MTEYRPVLERLRSRFPDPELPFEDLLQRRDVRQRRRRVAAAVVGIAVALAVSGGGAILLRSSPSPAPADPDHSISPFPIPPAMHNGPLTLFNGFGLNGVRELGTDGRPGGRLADCDGHCSDISDAAWTADGTRLAYVPLCAGGCASAGDPYHGIRVLDVRTGEDRVILPTEVVASLDWSPDGTRIAYSTWDGEAFILRVKGGDETQLPVHGFADRLSWSPDGTRIVYSTRSGHLFVMGIDGSNITPIGTGFRPDWSPDGSRIAVGSRDGCQLFTLEPDGSDRIQVADLEFAQRRPAAGCQPGGLALSFGPIWSPDGTQLATIAGRQVVLVGADGSDAHAIARVDRNYPAGLDWRPVP
jgi:WD40 repeat protein